VNLRLLRIFAAHEARLAWRSAFGRVNKPIARFILLAFLAIGAIGLSLGAAFGLKAIGHVTSPLAFAGISAGLVLLSTLMLAQALLNAVESIFVRADLEFLLGAPISPAIVLGVRMLVLALNTSLFWLVVAAGAGIGAVFLGDWRWLGLPLAVLGLGMAMVGLALPIADGLFRLFGARRVRPIAQGISGTIGVSVGLGFQFWNLSHIGSDRGQEFVQLAKTVSRLAPPVESWVWIPAKAFLADWKALSLWLLVTAMLFVWQVLRFSRRFLARMALAAGQSGGQRAGLLRATGPFRTGRPALIAKELRLILRNPIALPSLLLPFLSLAPLTIPLAGLVQDGGTVSVALTSLAASLIAWIALSTSRAMVGLTLLVEEAPDLAISAPKRVEHLQRAKLIAALAPAIGLAVLVILPLAFFSLQAGLACLIGMLGASLCTAMVSIRHGRPRAKKDLRPGRTMPRMPLGITVGGGFATSGFLVAVGLGASSLWPIALIPALVGLGLTLALLDEPVRIEPEAQAPPKPRFARAKAEISRFFSRVAPKAAKPKIPEMG
jgi:ABC-2 type transport system permease protein